MHQFSYFCPLDLWNIITTLPISKVIIIINSFIITFFNSLIIIFGWTFKLSWTIKQNLKSLEFYLQKEGKEKDSFPFFFRLRRSKDFLRVLISRRGHHKIIIIFTDPSIPRSRRNATWRTTWRCAPLAKDTNWDSCITQRATSHPCGFVVPVPLSREYAYGEGAERALKGTYTRGLHAEYKASCNSERLIITVADEVTGNTGDRTDSQPEGHYCVRTTIFMWDLTRGPMGLPFSALRRTPIAVQRGCCGFVIFLSLINPSSSFARWSPLSLRTRAPSPFDVL